MTGTAFAILAMFWIQIKVSNGWKIWYFQLEEDNINDHLINIWLAPVYKDNLSNASSLCKVGRGGSRAIGQYSDIPWVFLELNNIFHLAMNVLGSTFKLYFLLFPKRLILISQMCCTLLALSAVIVTSRATVDVDICNKELTVPFVPSCLQKVF